jgi:hypothetical protein
LVVSINQNPFRFVIVKTNQPMDKLILVAGATGKLGQKICRELLQRNVKVRAIVRSRSDREIIEKLQAAGAEIFEADLSSAKVLAEACAGVTCVVSAVAGLREVIVDGQTRLLKAAIAAGVPRFIPSDFSSDFTEIPEGENRNFDLRKEFKKTIDSSTIQATSIFNGCFAEILRYNTPLFNVKDKTISYYGDKASWAIDFTTMDDTAAFTAMAAIDEHAPRALHISSFSVSPDDLVSLSEKTKGSRFTLLNKSSMDSFSVANKILRAEDPAGESELYPRWQQAQYMYSMFLVHHGSMDNARYEGLTWSPAEKNI